MKKFGVTVSLSFLFLSGCLIVPIPQKVEVKNGAIITPPQADEKGLLNMSRDEILSELGNPSRDFFISRVFVYEGGLDRGTILWAWGAGAYGDAGINDWVDESGLLIAFDQFGSCVGYSFEKGSPLKIYLEAIAFAESYEIPYDDSDTRELTREIIVKEFGEPDWIYYDSRILVYEDREVRSLIFIFDKVGVLRSKILQKKLGLAVHARRWAEKHNIPTKFEISGLENSASLYIARLPWKTMLWEEMAPCCSVIAINGRNILEDPRPGILYHLRLPPGEYEIELETRAQRYEDRKRRKNVSQVAALRGALNLTLDVDEEVLVSVEKNNEFRSASGEELDALKSKIKKRRIRPIMANLSVAPQAERVLSADKRTGP